MFLWRIDWHTVVIYAIKLVIARCLVPWLQELILNCDYTETHDDVIKWKHFPRYWPFVQGIHRSPVNSPHKSQRRGALVFPLICTRINGLVNNGEAGDLRRYRAHYDVTVMREQIYDAEYFVTYGNVVCHHDSTRFSVSGSITMTTPFPRHTCKSYSSAPYRKVCCTWAYYAFAPNTLY